MSTLRHRVSKKEKKKRRKERRIVDVDREIEKETKANTEEGWIKIARIYREEEEGRRAKGSPRYLRSPFVDG